MTKISVQQPQPRPLRAKVHTKFGPHTHIHTEIQMAKGKVICADVRQRRQSENQENSKARPTNQPNNKCAKSCGMQHPLSRRCRTDDSLTPRTALNEVYKYMCPYVAVYVYACIRWHNIQTGPSA